ncbi:MAG: FAD-dependent oxidoreductase [Saprospiraceae bacterium]|nr:FAD-dependent oxidoreductase [Saprospiraceae bacterium]
MKISIIGSGINGLFSAYYLQKQGHKVTVIDQSDGSDSCSHGNAGMIVPSHIIPLAAPGMIAKGLRWMLSSTSPFYIRPRLSGRLLKWGWLFYKNATAAHVEKSIPILRDISLLSKTLYQDFQREQYFDFGWHERGLLMLYQTPAMAHEEAEGAAIANKAGIEAHVLSQKEVQNLEPNTKVNVLGGVLYSGDAHLNPNLLIANLKKYLHTEGVEFLSKTEVLNFRVENQRVKSVVIQGGELELDEVVVAVGAWSGVLTEKLGLSLPLQGGKGYSMMFEGLGEKVNVPAIMLEARATATPMGNHLRCAGTMEIAGIDLSVNMNRVKGIVQGVNSFYPELYVKMPQPETVWRGLRPCSPDGLPYIGRVSHLKNVTIATGHGMMGLSLGPATGKLVSEIVEKAPLSMRIESLSPMRF